MVTAFNHGTATGTNGFESGGDGGYYDGSLKQALKSGQFFGRLDYDFTDTLHGYVEVSNTSNHSVSYGTYNILNNVTLSSTDPFLSSAVQAQLAGSPTFKYSKILADMPRVDTNSQEDQTYIVAGPERQAGRGLHLGSVGDP